MEFTILPIKHNKRSNFWYDLEVNQFLSSAPKIIFFCEMIIAIQQL